MLNSRPLTRFRRGAGIPAAGLLVLAVAGCGGLRPGRMAPDFSLPDLKGSSVTLSEARGKAVLLSFVATWAAPCRLELAQMSVIRRKYGEAGLTLMAVTVGEEPGQVGNFFRLNPVSFTVLVGDEAVANSYFGRDDVKLPFTLLLDARGRILDLFAGYQTAEDLTSALEKALIPAEKAQ